MPSLIILARQRGLQRRLCALQAAFQRRQASSQHERRDNRGAQEPPRVPPISLQVPTYCIWGANTGVGKTLISAGLARAAVANQVRRAPLPRGIGFDPGCRRRRQRVPGGPPARSAPPM
jgi:hypothetical protein